MCMSSHMMQFEQYMTINKIKTQDKVIILEDAKDKIRVLAPSDFHFLERVKKSIRDNRFLWMSARKIIR